MAKRSTNRVERIRIRDFQALGDVSIEVGKVTVIRGSSDIGKSAVVRAVNGLLKNSVNKSHIRAGQGSTLIEVVSSLGSVKYSRSIKSSASYSIQRPGEDEVVHTKCGKIVPPEVFDAIGVKPFDLDSDVSVMPNISMQFGGQFPIDQSSSVISKLLGRISNLNIVFAAIRLLNAEEAQKTAAISATDVLIAMKQRQLQQFSAVEQQQECMVVLTSLNESLEAVKERCSGMLIASKDIKSSKKELAAVRASQLAGDIIIQKGEQSRRNAGKLGTAKKLFHDLSKYHGNAEKFTAVEQSSALISIKQDKVERAKQELESAQKLLQELSRIRLDHNSMVQETKAKLREQKTIKEEAAELVESQDVCPLIRKSWKSGCKEILRDSI